MRLVLWKHTETNGDDLERCHSCNEAGITHPRCYVMMRTPSLIYSLLAVLILGASFSLFIPFLFYLYTCFRNTRGSDKMLFNIK